MIITITPINGTTSSPRGTITTRACHTYRRYDKKTKISINPPSPAKLNSYPLRPSIPDPDSVSLVFLHLAELARVEHHSNLRLTSDNCKSWCRGLGKVVLCLDTRLDMDMDNLLPASRGGRQGFCSILLANSGLLLLALVFLFLRGGRGFFIFTITGGGFLSDTLEEPFDCMQPMAVVREPDPGEGGMMNGWMERRGRIWDFLFLRGLFGIVLYCTIQTARVQFPRLIMSVCV